MASLLFLGSLLLLLTLCTLTYIIATPVNFASAGGLVPNGKFQEGPKPSNLKNGLIKGKYSLPKWVKKGSIEYVSGGAKTQFYYRGESIETIFNAPSSVHAVRIGREASLSQYLRVKIGSYYSLTFVATKTCPLDDFLRVSADKVSGDYYFGTLNEGKYAEMYAWAFKATSDILKVGFSYPQGYPEYPICGPLLEAVGIKELLPLPKTTIGNLVKNGDFEIGPHVIKNYTNGVYINPQPSNAYSAVPGWIVTSVDYIKYINTKDFDVSSGSSAVELLGEGRKDHGSIAQVIRTIPKKAYNLTFSIGDSNNGCIGRFGTLGIEAHVANKTTKFEYESQGTGGSIHANLKFQAISDRTTISFWSSSTQLSFVERDEGTPVRFDSFISYLCGPVLDDVRVVPLP